jgi:integrase/recombinase XerC/integrase/recombinase XerD
MGNVARLRDTAGMTVDAAADKYLAHVRATKSSRTWRAYGLTLRQFCDAFGSQDVAGLDPDTVAQWFTGRWADGSAQGWNANRAALTSAAAWWRDQPDIPVTVSPFTRIGRRAVPPDRSRALDRAAVDRLLTSQRIPLRERCLWNLLYDSAARSAEVLRLDVADLDLANHRARVTRKGGAHDVIMWKTRTARLLGSYLEGRRDGPVFVTERGAKSDAVIGAGDKDERGPARLSYERAEARFRDWTAALLGEAATLHQLRHSALTHDAEDGASSPLLMTKSGHTSLRTLGKYARPGTEALAAWQQQTDRTRRGRD